MVDGKPDPGGKDPGSSGGDPGGGNPPSKDNPGKPEGDWVKHETYSRTLGEAKKAKDELRDAQSKLAEYEKRDKKKEEDELKKKGELQKIIDNKEEEIAKLNDKISGYEMTFNNGKKLSAFFDALGGARVSDKYLGLVDTDRIVMNPETGEIDKTSAAKYAEEFKKEHPKLLETPGKGPGLPSDAPQGDDGLTVEAWKKLPLKERREKMAAVHKNKFAAKT